MNKKTFFLILLFYFLINLKQVTAFDINLNSIMMDSSSQKTEEAMNSSGSLKEVFAAQKQMTVQILKNLGIDYDTLPSSIKEHIGKPPTENMEALLSFSNGLDAVDNGDYESAQKFFSEASVLDPNFELAEKMSHSVPDFIPLTQSRTNQGKTDISSVVKEKSSGKAKDTADKAIQEIEENETLEFDFASIDSMDFEDFEDSDFLMFDSLDLSENFEETMTSFFNNFENMTDEEFDAFFEGLSLSDLYFIAFLLDDLDELLELVETEPFHGFVTGYLSRLNGSGDKIKPGKPMQNIVPVDINATIIFDGEVNSDNDTIIPQNGLGDGYLKFDEYGNIIAFKDFYSYPANKEKIDMSLSPYEGSVPSEHDVFFMHDENCGMQTGEYAFLQFNYEPEIFYAGDGTEYKFLHDGYYIAGGTKTPSSNIADLASSNQVLSYTGTASVHMVRCGSGGECTDPVETADGAFDAEIDFGSMELTSFNTSLNTTNYELSAYIGSPVAISPNGWFSANESDLKIEIGLTGSLAVADSSILSGSVVGTNAEGMVGTFAAERAVGIESLHAVGGFVGLQD